MSWPIFPSVPVLYVFCPKCHGPMMSQLDLSSKCPRCGHREPRARAGPVWFPCTCCEDFWCALHQAHAHDCECPPVEEWTRSPYEPEPVEPRNGAEREGPDEVS